MISSGDEQPDSFQALTDFVSVPVELMMPWERDLPLALALLSRIQLPEDDSRYLS